MRRILLSLVMIVGLTVSIAPVANAQTVTFPCGGAATYSVIMPEGVALKGQECSGELVLDGSVKIIGDHAFAGAKQLTSVTIPNSVTTIGEAAFSYTRLTSVTIPNSVTTIGDYAFVYSPLTSVTIGNSVTTIGDYAFSVNQLTSVTIGNSVTTIGDYAFRVNRLTSVTIPNSVTTIGDYAFRNNPLTSVTIPNSVTTIGDGAFSVNPHLVTVSIPDGLKILGNLVFSEDNSLTLILYCGEFTDFPITPTCSPEPRVLFDAAKAAADKALADKALADKALADKALAAKIAALKKITITCVKGKLTKKVTAVKPVCPSGFKKK